MAHLVEQTQMVCRPDPRMLLKVTNMTKIYLVADFWTTILIV